MLRPYGALLGALSVLVLALPAAAEFRLPTAQFEAHEQCAAFLSMRKGTNPGNLMVEPDQLYHAFSLNKKGGDFVHLRFGNERRWVHLSCGTLWIEYNEINLLSAERRDRDRDDHRDRGDERTDPNADFLPFFDSVDSGVGDPTPPAPVLSPFGEAMLTVCGEWGSHPVEQDFRDALDDAAISEEVELLFDALSRTVDTPNADLATFKDELAAIWFDADGFAHIYCGEPGNRGIGGLHWRGRYLQLQELGLAGRLPEERCGRQEIQPPIYTLGVDFLNSNGQRKASCPKGYGNDLSALDLMFEVTSAYKLFAPTAGDSKKMCLHRVDISVDDSYLAVFVMKSGGVRTFYPDATPNCDRNKPAEECLCEG